MYLKMSRTAAWNKIKVEFLQSDYLEVKPFLASKWLWYESSNPVECRWWAKEKKEFLKKNGDMELDLLKWEKSESLLPDKEDLKRLELWVIKAAWLKIKKHMKWEKVDTKLKEIWDIVRDGLWEKENKKEEIRTKTTAKQINPYEYRQKYTKHGNN